MTTTTKPIAVARTRSSTAPVRGGQRVLLMLRSKPAIFIERILLIVVLLGLWELGAANVWFDSSFTSRPSLIWEALVSYVTSGQFITSLGSTVTATLFAFVIGSTTGIAAGIVLGGSPYLDRLFGPLLVPLNSIPRIALAPLFIIWFGLTMQAKVVTGASIVFFLLLFNARAAVRSVEEDYEVLGKVIGLSKWQYFVKVIFPSAVPQIFAGIRLGITYSLLGVVATEMIAARDGLGVDLVRFTGVFNIAGTLAVLMLMAALATILSILADQTEKHLLRWR